MEEKRTMFLGNGGLCHFLILPRNLGFIASDRITIEGGQMARFDKDDVKRFVSEMKNPEGLLRECSIYHKMEPRDIIYIAARKVVLENPASELHILAGIKILLLTWNAAYFQRLSATEKERMEEDILKAYRKTKGDIASLRSESLESIDLSDPTTARMIKRIFVAFSCQKSIRITGASKAIHLIHPDLFVMWDRRIKENHHRLHPLFGVRSETDDECYLEFMKTSQEIAMAILHQNTMDELRQKHAELSEKSQLLKVFPQAALESLPKMLDECNYVRFSSD